MNKLPAKIFFVLGIGLLFTHQFITHHHEDLIEASSEHHHDREKHEDGLPTHSFDHTFSNSSSASDILKFSPQEIILLSLISFHFQTAETLSSTYYHKDDIRPPGSYCYSVWSRRGPPAC